MQLLFDFSLASFCSLAVLWRWLTLCQLLRQAVLVGLLFLKQRDQAEGALLLQLSLSVLEQVQTCVTW